MTYYAIPNATEPMAWGVQLSQEVPMLVPGILYVIMLAIALAGYSSEQRRIGNGKLFKWFAISSYITTILSFILYITPGLIPLYHIMVMVSLCLIITMAYIFDSRSEQNEI